VQAFRDAARDLIGLVGPFGPDKLRDEQVRLTDRLRRFGACGDAVDIWRADGIARAETVPELSADQFIALANRIGRISRDAR
jgi:malonate decarboxylase beta subunit